jgi:hypothetical protein
MSVPSVWRACGVTQASAPKPVIYSPQSMAGSPKASTRQSCKTPRRSSTSWPDGIHSGADQIAPFLLPLAKYCGIAVRRSAT